jgi:hypothetical protein
MKMVKGASEPRKVQPRLPPLMHDYLQDLVDSGLYGKTPTSVAQKLIEDGIKQAIARNHIDRRKPKKRRVKT